MSYVCFLIKSDEMDGKLQEKNWNTWDFFNILLYAVVSLKKKTVQFDFGGKCLINCKFDWIFEKQSK